MQYLNRKDAAEYLGLSPATLKKCKDNYPVTKKVGQLCYYSIDDLERYKAQRNKKTLRKPLHGQHFGRLTVIHDVWTPTGENTRYLCSCSCGQQTVAIDAELRRGRVKSCGCLTRQSQAHDLTGKQYGRLTVIERAGRYRTNATWRCRCECGTILVVTASNLTSGNSRSCGCLHKEEAKERWQDFREEWFAIEHGIQSQLKLTLQDAHLETL